MESTLYIDEGNCDNCYQCIRACPVQAIAINNFKASIIGSRCIECAECIDVCPQNLIGYVSHIDKCRNIIRTNETIVASIAPSWIGEFRNVSENKIVEALKLLGFTHISETTLGAEVVIKESCKKISHQPLNAKITSVCPVVNSLIVKKYPKLVPNIIEVDTPTVVHSRQLKQIYGNDVKVITIGSCVAAKQEVEEYDALIGASITFNELKEWLKDEGVMFDDILGHISYEFEPAKVKEYSEYVLQRGIFSQQFTDENVVDGGFVHSISGIDTVKMSLECLVREDVTKNMIFEMWACRGGCLYGPGTTEKISQFLKISRLKDYSELNLRNMSPVMPYVSFTKQFQAQKKVDLVSDTKIIEIIQSLSIDTSKELINCGSCGYFDCREFAKQVELGYAHKEMCVWLQKRLAEKGLSALIDEMNSGIAIVDSSFEIVEANKNFAALIGLEAVMAYNTKPRLEGFSVSKIVPFIKDIENAFEDNKGFIEKDIQIKDRLVKVTIIRLASMDRVIVVIRNLFRSDVQSDEIINRTRSVINDNLQTVQQIAYLLGETASRTEAVLNSIIESQKGGNEGE